MIGALRHRGELHKEVEQSNGRGGHYFNSVKIADIWFSLTELGAEKQARLNQYNENIKTEIFTRYKEEIDTNCFILHNTKKYKFLTVKELGNKQFCQIQATGGEIIP